MAVTVTTRLGLTRWGAGSDPLTRAQADTDNVVLEDRAAGYLAGPRANRPVAGAANRGFVYISDEGPVFFSNGLDWNEAAGVVPVGGIIAWSGSVDEIPAGWKLCDGLGGTPDLRGRFLVGASQEAGAANSNASYNRGAVGGADDVALTTAQLPSHKHGGATGGQSANHTHTFLMEQATNTAAGGTSARVTNIQNAGPVGGGDNYYPATNNPNVDHTHGITAEGAGGRHENRPRFYALAYIMRVV